MAGILSEAEPGRIAGTSAGSTATSARAGSGASAEKEAAIVVGVGINVAWAPPGAASLGASVDRGDLLGALLENLDHWCDRWEEAGEAYRRRCATVGRLVRVETPKLTIVGRAEAVEADGRLRVVAGGETHLFSAADVVHVRPPGVE